MSAAPRTGLRQLEPYISPQMDVRARLNTNECPYPLPESFSRDLAARVDRPEPLPRRAYDGAAKEAGRGNRAPVRRGVDRQRFQRDPHGTAAVLRRPGPNGVDVRADLPTALAARLDHPHGRHVGSVGTAIRPRASARR